MLDESREKIKFLTIDAAENTMMDLNVYFSFKKPARVFLK